VSIDRQKVIDAAQKFAAKNQFDKAVAEYQRVLREDPSDVRILLKVGDLQVRMNARAAAVETYTKVAQSYDQQGFFLKAVAVYKQILQIDPTRIDLYGRLSELYLKLGLTSDALQSLELLGQRYVKAGDDEALSDVYRRMLGVDPGSVGTRIRLAELLSRLGRGDDAAKEFEAGAVLLEKVGRLDEWSKVAERLFFHRPDDVPMALRLASYYLDRDDARRALPKLQIAYKANAKDVQTLELLASAFRGLGQIQKTLSVLKEVARLHGDAGRGRERSEVYQRVLELAPTDQEARDALRVAGRAAGRRTSSPPPPKKAESGAPAGRGTPMPSEEPDEVEAELLVVEDEGATFDLKPTVPPAPESVPPASGVHLPAEANDAARGRRPQVAAPVSVARPFAAPATSAAAMPAPLDRGPAAEALRLVNEAEIFLKYGLRSKVSDHLTRASRLDPVAADLHLRIRDLYVAMNDPAGVLQESLVLAGIFQESDLPAAVAAVRRALEIDPGNPIARQLLAMFGEEEPAGPEIVEASVTALVEPPETEVYASSDHFREYLPDIGGYEPAEAPVEEAMAEPEEPAPPRREIEDGLDEAEFFVTQGLYDDARDILIQLLEIYPQHPLVMDRWSEIEQILQAQEEGAPEGDEAIPLADEIGAASEPLWADIAPEESVSEMHAVFDAADGAGPMALSLEDCDTHYDLGIAYKEMGLLDDAIAEFRVATASPARRCIGELMLGICHVEKGDPATAIEHFREGLQSPQRTEHEELGLYFEIGNAYELLGDIGEALYYLQKVEKHDPSFRNVRARVQSIQLHGASGPMRSNISIAPGAEEVDQAFDDLLKD
jgi:tetratricopeptide (TPR) repeat protein